MWFECARHICPPDFAHNEQRAQRRTAGVGDHLLVGAVALVGAVGAGRRDRRSVLLRLLVLHLRRIHAGAGSHGGVLRHLDGAPATSSECNRAERDSDVHVCTSARCCSACRWATTATLAAASGGCNSLHVKAPVCSCIVKPTRTWARMRSSERASSSSCTTSCPVVTSAGSSAAGDHCPVFSSSSESEPEPEPDA